MRARHTIHTPGRGGAPAERGDTNGKEAPMHASNPRFSTPEAGLIRPALIKMDTHCHSRASSAPVVPALGLIGCPECYTEPEAAYGVARERGMDLFTLTDHDTIAGAMELIERGFAGVCVGEEVTSYFPDDGCKVHVLVWTHTPQQHEQIRRLGLRRDAYALAAWLYEQNLPHALAHPLYGQNIPTTRAHLDRCAILFKNFEVLNGAHSGTHAAALEGYLGRLTPGRMLAMVQERGREPLWPRAWEKGRTGGSDDHGAINIGRAWTAVPANAVPAGAGAMTPREFFQHVMAGRCAPGGEGGHASVLAHQLAAVAARYAAKALVPRLRPRARHAAKRALRLAGIHIPGPSRVALVLDALRALVRPRRRDPWSVALAALAPAVRTLARTRGLAGRLRERGNLLADHEATTRLVEELHAGLHALLAPKTARAVRKIAGGGRGRADLSAAAGLGIAHLLAELTQLPYVLSLIHQNKESAMIRDLREPPASPGTPAGLRVCVFTDTLGDVNGVSRFIRTIADQAGSRGRSLSVLTSTRMEVPSEPHVINVPPVAAMPMPRYEHLELVWPPVLALLRRANKLNPDVIHVSTPGPVGMVGVLAAKALGVPLAGVYHTDFPAYVERLFGEESYTWAMRAGMGVFYKLFDGVLTRSRSYVGAVESLGVPRGRLRALTPGIDLSAFDPRFRDEGVWGRLGVPAGGVKVAYIGRVSLEKNMPLLERAWRQAHARVRGRAHLVVVGDGPYLETMRKNTAGLGAYFLGFRHGQELSRLYASSDLFVFPSTTDTLGQVVMEAQASGLPALVSNEGGPREVIEPGVTGEVIAGGAEAWARAIEGLVDDHQRRAAMGRAAHALMRTRTMDASFEEFWRFHEELGRPGRGAATAKDPAPGAADVAAAAGA